ncbi:PQQ-binding-like beta-propeller repeat protein [Spongiivirga sp. MCCC 1A20706]|uniref:PQQ-binding-like beta-propeller repeat protein n=1 Tax=Spongiivirga sp. MCCC 1A20706 TaxID=3160963 RepID=UPI0039773EB8
MKNFKPLLLIIFLLLVVVACNKEEEEQEIETSESFDDFNKAVDIYFVNGNILYGVRDNDSVGGANAPDLEKFLEYEIPSNDPTTATPIIFDITESTAAVKNYEAYQLALATGNGGVVYVDVPDDITRNNALGGNVFRYHPITKSINGSLRSFIGSSTGTFSCITNNGGTRIWAFESPTVGGFEGATFAGTNLVVTTVSNGWVYALDETDGSLVWSYDTGDLIQSKPKVIGGKLIVARQDGTIFALNPNDGKEEWNRKVSGPILTVPSENFAQAPNINPNAPTFLVSSLDRKVYDVLLDNGDINWSIELDGSIYGSIAYHDNHAYAVTNQGTLYKLDIPGGLFIEWEVTLPGNTPTNSSPLYVPVFNRIYINNSSGLYGIDAETGTIVNKFIIGETGADQGNANYQSSPVGLELPNRSQGNFFPVFPPNI